MGAKAFQNASKAGGLTVQDAIAVAGARAGQEFCVASEYTFAAELTTVTGFIPLIAVPAGARLTQFDVVLPDLDGSTGDEIAVDIGPSTDPDGFHDGATTIPQSAGTLSLPAADLFTRFDADTLIGLTVAIDAETAVTSGVIRTICRFIYDPAA